MSDWYVTRPPAPTDIPGLLQVWADTYRKSRWAGALPNNIYWDAYSEAFRQLLNRGARVLVAASADHPDLVLGWIVYEPTARGEVVCHYVYVKPLYRRRGLANALLDAAGLTHDCVYTFRTEDARFWPKAKYVPGIARRKEA